MHRRRRTALTLSAALLCGAPLLTACGSDAHPGAAAVVGDQRIAVAELQSRVTEVREAQPAAEGAKTQALAESGKFTRDTLQTMIFDQVLERAAADRGVNVTRKEVRDVRAQQVAQAGGAKAMETVWLQQFGVAPSRIDDSIRTQYLFQKLAGNLGVDTATGENQEVFWKTLEDTAKQLGVDVNPRYGTWDAKKSMVGTVTPPWVRDAPEAAEPA